MSRQRASASFRLARSALIRPMGLGSVLMLLSALRSKRELAAYIKRYADKYR